MKSNELLPFIRNRYYKGKMLTSSDFEAEQMYMNHKRRFINQMINGSGIACGLNVISLDDLSLMIESGMAIDAAGREIVVENSIVKKLSAIAGFEDINTEYISLCIRYKEKDVQPIYAINRQTTENEYEYLENEILSKGVNSPFIGNKYYGFTKYTIVNGKIVYKK